MKKQDNFISSNRVHNDFPLLKINNLSLSFPGVLALDNVDFFLKPGETHVLFGENGAGKSTLCSVISGVYQPDQGTFFLKNKPVQIHSTHHARELGISAVYQEFSLVGNLTVKENLFLGSEPTRGLFIDKAKILSEAKRVMKELGFSLDIERKVNSLSRAEQQMIEIAKAFRGDLSVLILDEPTASLTDKEAEHLYYLMEKAKKSGVGLIYITHRMSEIRELGDRVSVLRDGKYVATVDAKNTSNEELIQLMTGRVFDSIYPVLRSLPKEKILTVSNLTTANGKVKNSSYYVKNGEIVGFAGLVGSGKSEVVRAAFGLEKIQAGQVIFDGENVTHFPARKMLARGFYYNSSDRRKEGLVMVRSCRENMTLSSLTETIFSKMGFLRTKNEKKMANRLCAKFSLNPLNPEIEVLYLSGGNQQKVMLSKSLTRNVKLFVFDEPTVGVDVGTRVEIYKFIAELCENGSAVILISSDLAEIIHLSTRLYVMNGGEIRTELHQEEINEENALRYFFEKTDL